MSVKFPVHKLNILVKHLLSEQILWRALSLLLSVHQHEGRGTTCLCLKLCFSKTVVFKLHHLQFLEILGSKYSNFLQIYFPNARYAIILSI